MNRREIQNYHDLRDFILQHRLANKAEGFGKITVLHDVVYVEPNDAKKRNARYSQAQQYSITVFSSILSAISVVTTVILAITK